MDIKSSSCFRIPIKIIVGNQILFDKSVPLGKISVDTITKSGIVMTTKIFPETTRILKRLSNICIALYEEAIKETVKGN